MAVTLSNLILMHLRGKRKSARQLKQFNKFLTVLPLLYLTITAHFMHIDLA